MKRYFDEREIMLPELRETELFGRLPDFLYRIRETVPAWKERLNGLDVAAIKSRDTLATLPVLRKQELMEAQSKQPPFGGFADMGALRGARYFMSPGPIWEPQISGQDHWGGARAFFAAGIGLGDLVHCALSYHQTPGGFILDTGARATGANVFPGGVGNTEQQVQAAATLQPTAYAGTPDFLKILLDKAEEMNLDLSSIKKAVVSGGALFPKMRDAYRERGVRVMQNYATADFGVIAYETQSDGEIFPGMVVNEDLIVEIVRPGSGDPVEPGEVGELVVTNFNPAYPLLRLATGDLSAVMDEPSPCGRTNLRIKGWMGRADQRTKVKGMFVDPRQINELVKSFPGIRKARLEVSRNDDNDVMLLKVLLNDGADASTADIAAAMSAATKLKGEVETVDDLPNDGQVIADLRDYEK